MKDDFIAALKKGANLNVSVQNQGGREVTFAVPVAGFAKAFDGPAIDPKVLEDQQKKLQDELEKRSEELRKQLGSGASAPGAAAPAAPARPRGSAEALIGLSQPNKKRRAHHPAFFMPAPINSVSKGRFRPIGTVLILLEHVVYHRIAKRLSRSIGQEVLLRNVRDVLGFGVFGEQVVEWLIFAGPDILRNR